MKQVIAMHGWGCNNTIWKQWKIKFQNKGWLWQSGERGYGTISTFKPNWHKETFQASSNRKAIICHSLGAHLIEKEILQKVQGLPKFPIRKKERSGRKPQNSLNSK